MKKRGLRVVTSVIMAATMLAASGCGSQPSTGGDSGADTSASDTEKKDDAAAESGDSGETETSAERQTVTFMTLDFNAGASNTGEYAEQILNDVEDYCGCDIEIEWVLNDVAEEKTTLALANPATMPMIMTYSGEMTGQIANAAKAGAYVNLNDYIWDSEKYPNLSQLNENVAKNLTVDGALIAIPRTRDIGRYGVSYRQDWAEAVGITEAPKTAEDMYNLMYKFTYEDPDGNGQDDTYGMEMTSYTGPFDIIQTWFGCGNGWAEVDGKLVPVHMQDEYIEALDWIKKCYDDGLMPADWTSRTTDTWSEGCKKGESGVYIDVMDGGRRIWDYFVNESSFTPSVVNAEEPASMNLLGAVNGKTLATSGYNGYFTLSASTCDTPEKIEAALTLLDRINDNDIRRLCEFGIEGINWEKDADGNLVDLDIEDTALANNYLGLNQIVPNIPRRDIEPAAVKNERTQRQAEVYAENEAVAVFNPALPYLANSTTYADLGSTLNDIISQARTQYICGQIDKDGLEAAKQQWLDQGGQAIIDEVNAQYSGN
ncbi:MAG: ABC transporter substrate-binding protein [Eubacterium sp.]|nr:ABC transporter substrate-binding protein [Eubacterium sp.]